MKLYSFDIFDTLITRTVAAPEGIFSCMQRELSENIEFADIPVRVRTNFYFLRIQCEAVARASIMEEAIEDITLPQIYQCIKNMLNLTQKQMAQLQALELRLEYENSIPIVSNINKVKNLLGRGKRVVLISNMYLLQSDIRRLLVKADPIFNDLPIYVSGELGKTKDTCALYDYVKQQEAADFEEWLHFGDNKALDMDIPLRLGMQAELCTRTGLLPWERDFLGQQPENVELQMLIGASLRARQGRESRYPYTVGAGYAAPLLYPYVRWLLQESVRHGFFRLFFIARDGYVLKEIADIIIREEKLAIKTFYLYGSRKAWRLPAVTNESFNMEEFLTWNYAQQAYSYERIAEIFGMSVAELSQFVPFEPKEGVTLSYSVVKEVLRILKDNQKAIVSYVAEHQREKRAAVIEYLKQTLDVNGSNFAFVDLIGSGYTQKCLAELMKEWCSDKICTFFYRMDCCISSDKNINYAYYPNLLCMGNIIEVLCSANHGQTEGYVQDKGTWKPILEEDEGRDLDGYGFQAYLDGVRAYTSEMLKVTGSDVPLGDLRIPAWYFEYMEQAKDKQLFQYIADMPYGIFGLKNETKCFAPCLSNQALRQLYLFHRDEPVRKYYSGYALDFSLLRLTDKQRKRIKWYTRISNTKWIKWIQKHLAAKKKNPVKNSNYDLIADEIILYGAGKRGRLLYQQLTKGKRYHAQVILWVDKKSGANRNEGLDVWPPEKIKECAQYKQIVIAVMDREVAEEIRKELIEFGVPKFKMLWVCPDKRADV